MDGKWTSTEASLISFASEIIKDINDSYAYWEGGELERSILPPPTFDRNQTEHLLGKFREAKEWAEKLY